MKPSPLLSPKPGGFAALCLLFGAVIFPPTHGLNAAEKDRGPGRKDTKSGRTLSHGLTCSPTPYYRVIHDLNRGGAISLISYTHGKSENLLKTPLACGVRIAGEKPGSFTDGNCPVPEVKHERSRRCGGSDGRMRPDGTTQFAFRNPCADPVRIPLGIHKTSSHIHVH